MLLAAYPVLFLYGQNLGELEPSDLVAPLVVIVAAALALLLIAAPILGDARRAALGVSALAAALLLYGHLAGVLAPLGVKAGFQQIGWAVFLVVVAIAAVRLRDAHLAGMTRALNIVTALLVVFALVTIVPGEVARFGRGTTAQAAIGGSAGPGRDIWYLVFDRYGSASSLDLQYEIDDRPFLDRLRERGFQIVTDSHANYVKTSLSLAATLNLDYLDDLVAAQDPASDDHGPVFERLSDHAVGRFLRERGYQYVHVGSFYGPTKTSKIADRNLPPGGPSDFVASLYDTSAIPAAAHRLGISLAAPARERHYEVGRFQLDTLDDVADDPGPAFVFAHVMIPHPPYTFASDGSFVTDEQDVGRRQARGVRRAADLPADADRGPGGPSCWPVPRRSGRSSSSRRTRAPIHASTPGTRSGTTGRPPRRTSWRSSSGSSTRCTCPAMAHRRRRRPSARSTRSA